MRNLRNSIFFLLGIFAVCLFFPKVSQAQITWNGPVWDSTSYANNMIRDRIYARMRTRNLAAKRRNSVKKAVPKKSGKKVVRRKSRRVSVLENMIEPTYIIVSDSPKRIEIA